MSCLLLKDAGLVSSLLLSNSIWFVITPIEVDGSWLYSLFALFNKFCWLSNCWDDVTGIVFFLSGAYLFSFFSFLYKDEDCELNSLPIFDVSLENEFASLTKYEKISSLFEKVTSYWHCWSNTNSSSAFNFSLQELLPFVVYLLKSTWITKTCWIISLVNLNILVTNMPQYILLYRQ